jgi:hypothetical protein
VSVGASELISASEPTVATVELVGGDIAALSPWALFWRRFKRDRVRRPCLAHRRDRRDADRRGGGDRRRPDLGVLRRLVRHAVDALSRRAPGVSGARPEPRHRRRLLEAALSFLGVGVRPPTASWGQMISDASMSIGVPDFAWWYLVFPGAALLLTVLAFNLVGDGLLDALNPRGAGTR